MGKPLSDDNARASVRRSNNGSSPGRRWIGLVLLVLGGTVAGVRADALAPVAWRAAEQQLASTPAWLAWRELIEIQRRQWLRMDPGKERAVLEAVNAFWNRIPYVEDQDHWGVEDYWASPLETLLSNGADCEDYVIGKYFTLIEIGVAAHQLRLTHAALKGSSLPHMVLAYYPRAGADALILDNLTPAISPSARRTDLLPVYGFNDEYYWLADSTSFREPANRMVRWRELRERIASQAGPQLEGAP